jgi:hypothetical protein
MSRIVHGDKCRTIPERVTNGIALQIYIILYSAARRVFFPTTLFDLPHEKIRPAVFRNRPHAEQSCHHSSGFDHIYKVVLNYLT